MTLELPESKKHLSFESDQWDDFQEGSVAMTVPMRFGSMTINKSGMVWRKTKLIAEMQEPGIIALHRHRNAGLQVYDADQFDKSKRYALKQPLGELVISRANGLWTAGVDPENVNHDDVLIRFIKIAGVFASRKQFTQG